MKKQIIIAIDGFSSTGKSTLAKQLAAKLGYVYVDTGAMYRAVTLYAMQHDLVGRDFLKKDELLKSLENINLSFVFNDRLNYAQIYLNDSCVEDEIRSIELSQLVSKIAAISEVRKKLVEQQQKMGNKRGVVMDGRDIGTVVFPDAELKLFLTASPEKRAVRRYKELLDKGHDVNYKEVLENVQERDLIDSTRADSPLMKAADAIEIDNSDMGIVDQFNRILSLSMQRIKALN